MKMKMWLVLWKETSTKDPKPRRDPEWHYLDKDGPAESLREAAQVDDRPYLTCKERVHPVRVKHLLSERLILNFSFDGDFTEWQIPK
jgi:hypothetical protein